MAWIPVQDHQLHFFLASWYGERILLLVHSSVKVCTSFVVCLLLVMVPSHHQSCFSELMVGAYGCFKWPFWKIQIGTELRVQ